MTSNQFSSRRAVDEDWHAVTGRRAIRRGEVDLPLLQLLLRGWTLHSRSITLNFGEISFRRGYHALAMERVLVCRDKRREAAKRFVHLLGLRMAVCSRAWKGQKRARGAGSSEEESIDSEGDTGIKRGINHTDGCVRDMTAALRKLPTVLAMVQASALTAPAAMLTATMRRTLLVSVMMATAMTGAMMTALLLTSGLICKHV